MKGTSSAALALNEGESESGDAPASQPHLTSGVVLDVEVSLTSESHFFVGLTADIATCGVFVATYRPLPIGARVEMEIALPSANVRVRGTVSWVRERCEGAAPGLGVAVDDLAGDNLAHVGEFCARRAPLYYELDEQAR